MHKVQVPNYSSCTCRSSENICKSSGGAHEKGKMGSKPDETQGTDAAFSWLYGKLYQSTLAILTCPSNNLLILKHSFQQMKYS
jgi:hypothetical protein